jgi:EAL domain-containing protein (putative c-di-GMP-specific phosphodiesterase class I)/integral membrane sensor domain MASE1
VYVPAVSRLRLSFLAKATLVALVYFAAARLSLVLAIPPGYATPVWPPSGIAVASALLLGNRIWPGVWLGAFLANVGVEASVLPAIAIATGNTLEACIAAMLTRRFAGERPPLERVEDVFRFILLAAVGASVAATGGLLSMWLWHELAAGSAFRNWWTWWQGDFAGIILVAPLILSWSSADGTAWSAQKRVEAACFGFFLIVTAVAISSEAASNFVPFSLTFIALPFILWAAFRFGQREVTTAIAVVCGVAVWYALDRREVFASLPLNELLLMLLTFISLVVATGLTLASVVSELQAKRERSFGHRSGASGRVAEQVALENRLRTALEREEFVLYYQPQVDVDTRRLTGLEALIRWNSPDLGLVAPQQFIPSLEETGLILQVGQWALKRAVHDQALWTSEGVEVPRVAINVSAIQLRQPDFVDSVRDALQGRCSVDLEITESRIMEEIDANIEKLKQLRSLGVRIAIDDFGTGYSSLAYLARLPVHALKIDRTFIQGMLKDDETMAVVQTIIALGHSLELVTVAEGVETEEQADVLALLRCERMQGYLIGMPQPREQLAEVLRTTGEKERREK